MVPSGPKIDGMHLYVIMTNACAKGEHLLISITSVYADKAYDSTCQFFGGEHPQINHHCYAFYKLPERRQVSHIQKCVSGWLFHARDQLSEPHFSRMCAGIAASPFSEPRTVAYYNANCTP